MQHANVVVTMTVSVKKPTPIGTAASGAQGEAGFRRGLRRALLPPSTFAEATTAPPSLRTPSPIPCSQINMIK
ncbi:hypothetical protein SKAU_G00290000 [Synaphobranchus kaupii]|uniref:Uncharacterized protein n=1 Tax=Synaphobranchus kaupii TaxID=118154 RepID=A0A9Q1ETK6_SYNKA|nr:hypothetical protein SKAU_G00290000 [Synaphobranchus kaupii]